MILLDTCVLPLLLMRRFVPKTTFCVSAVTYGEGLRSGERTGETASSMALHDLLHGLGDDLILPYTHVEARLFSRFAAKVASPKRVADMMIAATALSHDLKLVTADRRMAKFQSAISTIHDLPPLMVEVIGT